MIFVDLAKTLLLIMLCFCMAGEAQDGAYLYIPANGSASCLYAHLPTTVQLTPTAYSEKYLVNNSTVLLIEGNVIAGDDPTKLGAFDLTKFIIFEDFVESCVFVNEETGVAGIVELMYFMKGAPQAESVQKVAVIKLSGMGKEHIKDSYRTQFAGYSATVYNIINPLNDRDGKMTQFRPNDFTIVNVVADIGSYETMNRTMKIGEC